MTPEPRAQPFRERFAPEIAQTLVVLLWSSTFIVSKWIFVELSPLPYTAVRFLLMDALAIGVMLWARKGSERWIAREDWPRLLAVAFTGYTLYQLFFVLGLARTSPFSSSLLVAMVPLFTVLMTTAMGERTPAQGWIGLAVSVAGAAVFLWDKRGQSGTLAGDLLSIGAAVAFAAYGVLARPLVTKYPSETFSAWTIALGSIPLFLIAIPSAMREDWGAVSGLAWAGIAYMAVFPVYVAYRIWNWAIARRGIAAATSFSLLVPIASGVLSALLFGEAFGPVKLIGAALVLAGLVIIRVKPRTAAAAGESREA